MRNAFAAEITARAEEDPRVVLLSGDIGNRLFNDYKEKCPDRFLNCGVAEANMTSVAAGMAMCGLRPVTYTITPFVTTRCLEQIRVDICYHELPVVIVAVGAGLSYASLGATHHACEDISFLRSLPHMKVVCPGDAYEVKLALRAALGEEGPVYIRLGKKGEPLVHSEEPPFTIGRGIVVREGSDLCLLSTGTLLPIAAAAAELLEAQGMSAQLVSMHTVKPLDEALLGDVMTSFPVVVTIEEHSLIGGLGGAVAEWMADRDDVTARLLRIGTPDTFIHKTGEQDYVRDALGLTPAAVAERVSAAYAESTTSGFRK